jgi:succinoglycan biosynthesis protein ExoO
MIRPEVSIIIPAYNSEKYLHGAIASALNQTYNNLEVIS